MNGRVYFFHSGRAAKIGSTGRCRAGRRYYDEAMAERRGIDGGL